MAEPEQASTAKPFTFWLLSGLCAALALASLGCLFIFYSSGDSEKLRAISTGQHLLIDPKTGTIDGNMRASEPVPEPEATAEETVTTPDDEPPAFDIGTAQDADPTQEIQSDNPIDDFVASDDEVANAIPAYPRTNASLNAAPNPELTETTQSGSLPKAGAAGTPMRYYGRPFTPTLNKPVIAIVITHLGASKTATEQALKLPLDVTLAFNPYAEYTPLWLEGARNLGHESWLMLPVEPEGFPANDPGPLSLLQAASEAQNKQRLHQVMQKAAGFAGLVLPPDQTLTDNKAARDLLLEEAKERGIALLLSEKPLGLAANAFAEAGDHALTAQVMLDAVPTSDAITKQLALLEATAREKGFALGVSLGYPAGITAIDAWVKKLDAAQFQLAPATALMGRK